MSEPLRAAWGALLEDVIGLWATGCPDKDDVLDLLSEAHFDIEEEAAQAAERARQADPVGLDVATLSAAIHDYRGVCSFRYRKRTCQPDDHRVMAAGILAALSPDKQPKVAG